MRGCRSLSNDDLDPHSKIIQISPHPPNEPCSVNNEAAIRLRQQRYRRQNSKQRIIAENRNVSENRSGKSRTCLKVENLLSGKSSMKTTISSAPSPRNRTPDYRLSNMKKEDNSGLYTFNSIPLLIQDSKDEKMLPIMKRKQPINCADAILSETISVPPKLPPISISKAIIPCLSQTSPVISLLLVKKQSLQRMSKEKLFELSRRSILLSDFHGNSNLNETGNELNSPECLGHAPIDLNQYRSPNDLSDSFEAKMLASLVAECAQVTKAIKSSKSPKLHNSKNFSASVIPRPEQVLVGDSYSDSESSMAVTGPFGNKSGVVSNVRVSALDQNGMHGEWKQRMFNQSQDLDKTGAITDSCCNSVATEDVSSGVAGCGEYVLVHYIADLDCYIEPKTGMFYESNV